MKIFSKTHQITPFKKFSRVSIPPNATSIRLATPRVRLSRFVHATHPALQKVVPLLANPAYAHGLPQRNLFEEMRS